MFHGKGIYRFSSGGSYDGHFTEGRFSGTGIYKVGNIEFSGQWVAGRPHGHGVYKDADSIVEGEWVDGRFADD